MSTINLLTPQDQALALLQSAPVKSFQDDVSKEDESKTAAEKIQYLVGAQPAQRRVAANAQVRIVNAELRAKEEVWAREIKTGSFASVGSLEGRELRNMIMSETEKERLKFYNETREKIQVYVKRYLTADVQASRHTVEKILISGAGVDREIKDREDTTWVMRSHYWAIRNAFGLSATSGIKLAMEDFKRLSTQAEAIEKYYTNTYGQGSVEYITLGRNTIDARDDIIAQRDVVVEKHGHESIQYMRFMTDLLKEADKGFAFGQDIEGLGTLRFDGDNRITLVQKDGAKKHTYLYAVTDGELTKTHISTVDNSKRKPLSDAEIAKHQEQGKQVAEKLKQIDFSKMKNVRDFSSEIEASKGRWFDWVYEL